MKVKGFTLVEILVALFVFILIVGMISIAFRQVMINREILTEHLDEWLAIQTSMSILQNDMKQIANWQRTVATNAPGSFYTKDNNLYFSKFGYINPGYVKSDSTLRKIQYQITNGQLIRRVFDQDNQLQYQQVIFNGFDKITLTFYDEKQGRYDLWPPTAQWRNKIPYGIAFNFSHPKFNRIERIFNLRVEPVKYNEISKSS